MFLNIICPNKIHISLILQEKIAKFELSHQKKVLDECSSTMEFFLVKYVNVLFLSMDVLFSTLMKNTWKNQN